MSPIVLIILVFVAPPIIWGALGVWIFARTSNAKWLWIGGACAVFSALVAVSGVGMLFGAPPSRAIAVIQGLIAANIAIPFIAAICATLLFRRRKIR